MRRQKRDDLPTNLQVRHIAVEINPVQALDIQTHMPIEEIVHRQCRSHNDKPGRNRTARSARGPEAGVGPPTQRRHHRKRTDQPSHNLDGPRLASLVS